MQYSIEKSEVFQPVKVQILAETQKELNVLIALLNHPVILDVLDTYYIHPKVAHDFLPPVNALPALNVSQQGLLIELYRAVHRYRSCK